MSTQETGLSAQHPELFPQAIGGGYTFHGTYRSRKQQVVMRRIKLQASGEVFTLRPSLVMPYLIARTDAVEIGRTLNMSKVCVLLSTPIISTSLNRFSSTVSC